LSRGEANIYWKTHYVFISHHVKHFEEDVFVDLQSVDSVPLIKTIDGTSINNQIAKEGDKIVKTFARLKYEYRYYIIQKFVTYLSRVALPEAEVLHPNKDEKGLWGQFFDRAFPPKS